MSEQKAPSRKSDTLAVRHAGHSAEKFNGTTVYGRFNKQVEPFTEFKVDKYKSVFNAERMQGVTSYDAMTDPHLTILTPPREPDQGYYELNKRSTNAQDLKTKVITDYNGNIIVKIDSLHGAKNGGLYCQTTHNNLKGTDRPLNRHAFGVPAGHNIYQAWKDPRTTMAQTGAQVLTPRSRAARAEGRPTRSETVAEGELTEKQLLARKLYLMRKMLKNERRANEIISNKLGTLTATMHTNNKTVEMVAQNVRDNKRGVVALK
jgi:hypothetical protein